MERTLALIKPEIVRSHKIGEVIRRIEEGGFTIVSMKMVRLTTAQAEEFYAVHKGKPFFESLISYITSGPIVALVLEKEGAIKAWRELMGPTDPTKAPKGTIRAELGTSIQENAVHGSDSPENAQREISIMFSGLELV